MLFVTLLFVSVSAYSLFGKVRGADLFCDNKYEDRDTQDPYLEKGESSEGGLVSAILFSPLPDSLFELPSRFFCSITFLGTTFSPLRC